MTRWDVLPADLLDEVCQLYRATRTQLARADVPEVDQQKLLDRATVLETVLLVEGLNLDAVAHPGANTASPAT